MTSDLQLGFQLQSLSQNRQRGLLSLDSSLAALLPLLYFRTAERAPASAWGLCRPVGVSALVLGCGSMLVRREAAMELAGRLAASNPCI